MPNINRRYQQDELLQELIHMGKELNPKPETKHLPAQQSHESQVRAILTGQAKL